MRTRYVPGPARREDTLAATAVSLAVGAAAGLVTFYVTRMMLAREAIGADAPARALVEARDREALDAPRP